MHISHLKNKKTIGLDNISTYLLELDLPYVVQSLTYVYKLCFQKKKNIPPALKAVTVIPLFYAKGLSDSNTLMPVSPLYSC